MISFEKATEADVGVYLAIDKKVGGPMYSQFTTEQEVLDEIAKGPVYMIVQDGTTVGTISYQIREDGTAYLGGLAIDPAFQGQGIARTVLTQILEEIKDAPAVELVTHPENTRAISLYESLGFKITARKENYFGDGEPRVVLRLEK